jgi:thiol-disulfide isomerase/thioredoxin
MTKYILTTLAAFFICLSAFAKDGYQIKVRFTDAKDSLVYLCHYYGKNTTVFKDDSVRLNSKGEAEFKSTKKIVGGIYMLLFADKSASMELILLNGDQFTLDVTKSAIFQTAAFTGNTENTDFYEYQRFLMDYGKGYQKLEADLVNCKTKKDSNLVRDRLREKGKELSAYRRSFIAKKPNSFIATIFNAVEEPEIPEELPTLPDGKKDSTFPRYYYKKHYWDKFNLKDDRLIYTPLYERKLDDYMSKLVIPVPDSVNRECDSLLKVTEGHEEMFKYTLWYLTRWTETSKVMGMDESFVYLIENYYMRDKATWIDSAQLAKYIKRAGEIAPNMIGKPAMDLRMIDTTGKNVIPLSSIKADYTVLIFWSPTCGHCKKEIPRFDSVYQAALKKYNVKFFAVDADNEFEKWKVFINENNLNEGWTHVHDPQRTTNFRSFYDVYSTPTIYLLDDKKIIRGKRIDHNNLVGLIEFLEKKKKNSTK